VIGISVGAALTVLGPVIGLVTTVLSLNQAFEATSRPNALAENKAKDLAEGISMSMNATAFGIVVGVAGLIVLVASLVYLLVTNKKPAPADPP
jgi:biopolymer transport protein ExbB/TolQ